MEIHVEERLTGRALRDQLLAKYGSLERLAEVASRKGAHEAQDDLVDLRLLRASPTRLRTTYRVTTVSTLEAREVAKLTAQRLRLLDAVSTRKRPPNVTELAAALRRDKKNVSEDLHVLAALGLVELERRGREKRVRRRGREIRIVLAR